MPAIRRLAEIDSWHAGQGINRTFELFTTLQCPQDVRLTRLWSVASGGGRRDCADGRDLKLLPIRCLSGHLGIISECFIWSNTIRLYSN